MKTYRNFGEIDEEDHEVELAEERYEKLNEELDKLK